MKEITKDIGILAFGAAILVGGTFIGIRNINGIHDYKIESNISTTIIKPTGLSEHTEYTKYYDGEQVAIINSGNSIAGTKICLDLDGDNNWDVIKENNPFNTLDYVLVKESEDAYSRQRFKQVNKKLNAFHKKYFK